MRRKDRETSETQAYQLLDRCDWVTLGLVEPEGTPYCVPIQIVREENTLYFHSAKEGHKLDCLKHCQNVCVTCVNDVLLVPEKLTTKYKSAIFRGICQEIQKEQEKMLVLEKFCQRYAPSHMALVPTETSAHLSATSIWKITVTSLSGKEYI